MQAVISKAIFNNNCRIIAIFAQKNVRLYHRFCILLIFLIDLLSLKHLLGRRDLLAIKSVTEEGLKSQNNKDLLRLNLYALKIQRNIQSLKLSLLYHELCQLKEL